MNFFERQRHLRRMSVRLVLLFALAVVAIIVVVDLAVVLAMGALNQPVSHLAGLLVASTVVTAGAIGLATLYRTATLRGGGGRVARELGGDYVPHDTTDPALRRLRNVVEEIAIASGVAVPEVYVLQDESAINAFAAGWSTSDAAVAVTRGALETLNRDELQGVIAHEFSHVVNGDMRLNIRLIGLLFGIMFLALAGETMLRAGAFGRSRDEKSGGNPLPLIGIALVAAGWVGVLAGRLIKASVSRQREYLADAAAVQFTRQTAGIAGALKKIGGLPGGSRLGAPKAEEVGHMLFGTGSKSRASWFATHPPLAERIRALDPSFDPAQLEALAEGWAQSPPNGMREDLTLGLAGHTVPGTGPGPMPGARAVTAGDLVVSRVASPDAGSYRHAEAFLARIPAPFAARARSVDRVVPLVLGLLLSADPGVRTRQHADLVTRYDRATADAAWLEANALADLAPVLRLPLAELAFPALRHRTTTEQEGVLGAVYTLINADGRTSPFEYCLSRMLHRALYEALHPKPRLTSALPLSRARREVAVLLAVLAGAGQSDPAAADRAYRAGLALALPDEAPARPDLPGGVLALEDGWAVLDRLDPGAKETLVRAAVAVISEDAVAQVTEIELLRTVCALLHCPLPPLTSLPARLPDLP
ncbi:Zn-dependent protease [Longispora fulva]|uniref:Zn-dependent protease with chaperone function n=1 Tax=Longispora fulva TaxID=619741 RepID=A0A8J7G7B2_9ACTN|nr:M48 family metallopeptidase [Longispora fulva]MBG6135018.1 Zn-dependent protease with chaperone function [Longispora fulva]GIG56747.1 Zn-dependent protease [Longispora fulva]